MYKQKLSKGYKNQRKSTAQPKTRKRTDTNYVTHGIYNTTSHFPKAIYPKLPQEMEFSSAYSTYDIRAANTTPSVQIFGLIDFYNQLPAFAASFYQIYKYARINAVTVHVELVSTGSEPLIIAADVLPYSQANSSLVDPHYIAARPRAISRIVGGSSGASRVVLRKTWKTAETLGQLNYSDSAWQSYTEALSVLPDADHPFVCVAVDSVLSSATWAGEAVYRVTYHMQFFELQDPSLTLTPEDFHTQRVEAKDEDGDANERAKAKASVGDDSFRSRANRRK